MHPQLLARVWAYLGLATSLGALSTFSQIQGGPSITGALLIEQRPAIAGYYSVFVISALLCVLCLVGAAYARRSASSWWSGRLPVVGDDPNHPSDPDALSTKVYQAFFLAAFVLWPAVALIHFDRNVANQAVLWNESKDAGPDNAIATKYSFLDGPDATIAAKTTKTLAPIASGDKPRLWLADRLGDPKKAADKDFKSPNPRDLSPACDKEVIACRGVEWFHPWSAVLLASFTAASFGSVLLLLGALAFD